MIEIVDPHMLPPALAPAPVGDGDRVAAAAADLAAADELGVTDGDALARTVELVGALAVYAQRRFPGLGLRGLLDLAHARGADLGTADTLPPDCAEPPALRLGSQDTLGDLSLLVVVDAVEVRGDAVHMRGTCGEHHVSLCLPAACRRAGLREVRLLVVPPPTALPDHYEAAPPSARTPTHDAALLALDEEAAVLRRPGAAWELADRFAEAGRAS